MKKVKYGLIIAAGNQKRFKSNFPKALVEINGEPILDSSIKKLKNYCEEVYVVCSFENEEYFLTYDRIVISSGKGSGDAIYSALTNLEYSKEDMAIIQWGDSIVNNYVYSKIIGSEYNIIPCTLEDNPYVQVVDCGDGNINILFSKYGDKVSSGYHDMSVFIFNIYDLVEKSIKFVHKFYDGKVYKHKHNEFEFLDIFNDTDIKAYVKVFSDDVRTYSFNTIEELMNSINTISLQKD